MSLSDDVVVLVIEDGDEYLETLSLCVPEPTYVQVHTGAEALKVLSERKVHLIYLDMRFDRIAVEQLLGSHESESYLQNHQGLFVLSAVVEKGHGDVPVILAHDFSEEQTRADRLEKAYPQMRWVTDTVSPEKIRELMEQLVHA